MGESTLYYPWISLMHFFFYLQLEELADLSAKSCQELADFFGCIKIQLTILHRHIFERNVVKR